MAKQISDKNFKRLPENRWCAFCGIEAKENEYHTIDHFPPRSWFNDREHPEGFRVPACRDCNHNKANQELFLSLIIEAQKYNPMAPELSEDNEDKCKKLEKAVREKCPELLKGTIAQRVREWTKTSGGIFIRVDGNFTKMGENGRETLGQMCRYMMQSVYYKETGKVLKGMGRWQAFPGSSVSKQCEELETIGYEVKNIDISRNKKSLSKFFSCYWGHKENEDGSFRYATLFYFGANQHCYVCIVDDLQHDEELINVAGHRSPEAFDPKLLNRFLRFPCPTGLGNW